MSWTRVLVNTDMASLTCQYIKKEKKTDYGITLMFTSDLKELQSV